MEGAILSTPSTNRFRTHLKNAATALCARTLPKPRCSEQSASSARHHTYPRSTPPKRTSISCRMEPLMCEPSPATAIQPPETIQCCAISAPSKPNGVKLKGTFAREVAHAWECRIGPPDHPAPAHRVQSLFNDIELYPTKTQVFEMLVCARQCARRKSLILTFGEFCVFAAELRRCSRQTRQTSNKPDSPVKTVDKEAICKYVNGSEASPPPCEVFLGGSCNPTTWRSDIAIPMLKKMGITYFNPQVDDWSTELIEVEHRAKAEARALLFVLDSETRAVAACVEAAHLAAAPRDLLLVLRPYSRHQNIGRETISDLEYAELSRARATLQEAVERRGLPAFTDIPAALRCAGAVLRGSARTHPAHPRHSPGHTILRLKRAFDAAGGRGARIPRARALDALADAARAPRDRAERCLPAAGGASVDFEAFCSAVAELAADADYRNGQEEGSQGREEAGDPALRARNPRLRAYGQKLSLYIPKNGGRASSEGSGSAGGDSVLTPATERRLERLPSMLAHTHDVYLGGSFPSNCTRPEEILRREGFTYVVPRLNDYTRMFSATARRTAPTRREHPDHREHPGHPRDKKPRPDGPQRDEGLRDGPAAEATPSPPPPSPSDVVFRERTTDERPADRLSASDFYTVSEDITPQPFKGMYDEEQLSSSRVALFSLSAEAPGFAAMVLAAHYMGLRPSGAVLLVQPMDRQLAPAYSEAAVRDYNRGRHYLTDLARRAGVPVHDDLRAAMACVLQRLRPDA